VSVFSGYQTLPGSVKVRGNKGVMHRRREVKRIAAEARNEATPVERTAAFRRTRAVVIEYHAVEIIDG